MRRLLALLVLLAAPAYADDPRGLFDGRVSLTLPPGFSGPMRSGEGLRFTARPVWETLSLRRDFEALSRIARADGMLFGEDHPDCAAEAAFPLHLSCQPAQSLTLRLLPLGDRAGFARLAALFTPALAADWRNRRPGALLAAYCPPPDRGTHAQAEGRLLLTCYHRDAVTERPTTASRLHVADDLALHVTVKNGLLAAQVSAALFASGQPDAPSRAEAHAAYDDTRMGYWQGAPEEDLAGRALLDAVHFPP